MMFGQLINTSTTSDHDDGVDELHAPQVIGQFFASFARNSASPQNFLIAGPHGAPSIPESFKSAHGDRVGAPVGWLSWQSCRLYFVRVVMFTFCVVGHNVGVYALIVDELRA